MQITGGVRYAPSPTGRLHLGNLRTAWVSWRWAQALGLPWVVRFEDIDQPRVVPGAREAQLEDLASLGLTPDRLIVQSENLSRHWQVFLKAVADGVVYPCDCSRKTVVSALQTFASAPHVSAPLYTGSCRHQKPASSTPSWAWRFKMPNVEGQDDFIVARTVAEPSLHDPAACEFTPGYHWACAIDDFDGQYDLLVRAVDLASILPLQRALQAWLGQTKFSVVFHTSLVCQNGGDRLEKRTQGVTLPELREKGFTPADLLRCFENSFDRSLLGLPLQDVFQEGKPSLTLQELGV